VLQRELLSKLVDHAVRYTPAGGHITVDVICSKASVVLSVEDDGPGIPAADRTRVFERFQRLAEGSGDGCGLGLAIVREIAEAHGASVEIEDGANGKGTRVSVAFGRLPAAAAA
jgi:signal transduction histidine kinase